MLLLESSPGRDSSGGNSYIAGAMSDFKTRRHERGIAYCTLPRSWMM
jgi:hypothetical protein